MATAKEQVRAPLSFRQRVRGGAPLVGTFVKTPHHAIVEILGLSGLDFIILDAEHAPFDRADLDRSILAARAHALPVLVRIATAAPDLILAVLDMGADGIVVPHIQSRAAAERIAKVAQYRKGQRGFSTSSRAGQYGKVPAMDHIDRSDAEVVIIAQIEDAEALEVLEDIMAPPRIDAFFIGRADLMVSLEAKSLKDGPVAGAVGKICAAAKACQKTLAMFLPDLSERHAFAASGVSFFVIGADQAILRNGASALAQSFHSGEK